MLPERLGAERLGAAAGGDCGAAEVVPVVPTKEAPTKPEGAIGKQPQEREHIALPHLFAGSLEGIRNNLYLEILVQTYGWVEPGAVFEAASDELEPIWLFPAAAEDKTLLADIFIDNLSN